MGLGRHFEKKKVHLLIFYFFLKVKNDCYEKQSTTRFSNGTQDKMELNGMSDARGMSASNSFSSLFYWSLNHINLSIS